MVQGMSEKRFALLIVQNLGRYYSFIRALKINLGILQGKGKDEVRKGPFLNQMRKNGPIKRDGLYNPFSTGHFRPKLEVNKVTS